jgi:hypothetical protein
VLDVPTGLPKKVYGIVVCGEPIGSDVFERSWLAAKAGEIAAVSTKLLKCFLLARRKLLIR